VKISLARYLIIRYKVICQVSAVVKHQKRRKLDIILFCIMMYKILNALIFLGNKNETFITGYIVMDVAFEFVRLRYAFLKTESDQTLNI